MLSYRTKPLAPRDKGQIRRCQNCKIISSTYVSTKAHGFHTSCVSESALTGTNDHLDEPYANYNLYNQPLMIMTRRVALVGLQATAMSAAMSATAVRSAPAAVATDSHSDMQPSTSGRELVDTTITHRVSLTIGIAATALKKAEERTIGDKSIIPEAIPIGRVVIGLYGNAVPRTVSNFLALVASGKLVGTTFSRVLAGEYIQAGRQGSRRLGALEVPPEVQSNPEVSTASAFRLPHYRAGTVSLALGENDEEPSLRQRAEYRPLEFLITTGPGPVPRLDGQNIVFGRVLEGMSVVGQVAQVPVFGPSPVGNSRAFNALAGAMGDDRAAIVRRKYGKPLKAVVILGSEVLPEEGKGP